MAPNAAPSMDDNAQYAPEVNDDPSDVADSCQAVVSMQDSDYAWHAIVPGVFMVAFSVMGIQYCAGVMQSAFLDAFEESDAKTSWVTALAIGFLMMSMGPAGFVFDMLGPRNTVLLGGLVSTLGLFVSSFATELWHLFITHGIITSIAQGFAYLAAVSLTQQWFSPAKRAMAMAIASSGSGFGTACLGPLTQYLDEHESWRWSMRVLALINLVTICGAAMLFKSEPATAAKGKSKSQVTMGDVVSDKKLQYFCLVLFVLGLGIWNPQVHNVEVTAANGFSDNGATYANLFGFAAGAVIGRPLSAKWFAVIGRRPGFVIICAALALFAGVFPKMSDETWKVVLNNFFYGVSFGSWISIMPAITAEVVGMEKLGLALGLMYAAPGLTMMVGPPICGYIKASGDPATAYDTAYYLSAGVMGIATLMAIPMIFWENQIGAPPPPAKPVEKEPCTPRTKTSLIHANTSTDSPPPQKTLILEKMLSTEELATDEYDDIVADIKKECSTSNDRDDTVNL